MRTDRLTVLAEQLEQLDVRLNMHAWKCGTAACALGHACMLPEFNEQGLQLVLDDPDTDDYVPAFQDEGGHWRWGFGAAQGFFEISREQAYELFEPHRYPGTYTELQQLDPKRVAARIRELLANAGKEQAS